MNSLRHFRCCKVCLCF